MLYRLNYNSFLFITLAFCFCFASLIAQPVADEDNVALDYDYLLLGGSWQRNSMSKARFDVGSVGAIISKKVSKNGVVTISPSLGNADIDILPKDNADVVQLGAGYGYIVEMKENLHIVPSIGLNYQTVTFRSDDFDGIALQPSVAFNYAPLERLQLTASLNYYRTLTGSKIRTTVKGVSGEIGFEKGHHDLGLGLGIRAGITKNIGLNIGTVFVAGLQNFLGGFSYHF